MVGKGQEPLTALVVCDPLALTGAGDALLHLWNLDTYKHLGTLSGHSGAISSVNVSFPRFRALSSSRDCTLRLWDLAEMSCLAVLTTGSPVATSAVDFGQSRAICCCQDRSVQLWDLDSCMCIGHLPGHLGEVRSLVLEDNQALSGSADRTIRIWHLPEAHVAHPSPPRCCGILAGHSSGIRALAANFARCLAVSGADDRLLRVWDLSTKKCTAVLEGHDRPICSIAVDFETSHIWSAAGQGMLKIWDLRKGVCQETLSGHEGRVVVAVDVERGLAISGGEEGAVRVWNAETLQCVSTQTAAHRGPVQAVAV